jgi:hypothetical protein
MNLDVITGLDPVISHDQRRDARIKSGHDVVVRKTG